MSGYTERIAALKQRISTIGTQLASVADRRKSYALAASDNDTTAIKEITALDFEADTLRKDAATLSSALETAEALDKQNALDLEQQQLQRRQIEAHNHAQAIAALNCEIDEVLVQLRAIFERRASLLVGLARTELVDPTFVARFGNKSLPTRAACAAGLHKFLALETVAPSSMVPLASSNPTLLGIGRSSDAKPPRTKFRGDA
jgi:hypothetical protein